MFWLSWQHFPNRRDEETHELSGFEMRAAANLGEGAASIALCPARGRWPTGTVRDGKNRLRLMPGLRRAPASPRRVIARRTARNSAMLSGTDQVAVAAMAIVADWRRRWQLEATRRVADEF